MKICLLLCSVLLFGCGESNRSLDAQGKNSPAEKTTPGAFHSQGLFSPFYGEEVFENRIYLFGQQQAYDKFIQTHQVDVTKSKTYIGEGPNHETVIVQTDKEALQMTERVYQQFRHRYGLK